MCHFLPVHHFVMACLLGPKVKMQQNVFNRACYLTGQTLWLWFLFQDENVSKSCMTNAQSEYNDFFSSWFSKSWSPFSQGGLDLEEFIMDDHVQSDGVFRVITIKSLTSLLFSHLFVKFSSYSVFFNACWFFFYLYAVCSFFFFLL